MVWTEDSGETHRRPTPIFAPGFPATSIEIVFAGQIVDAEGLSTER